MHKRLRLLLELTDNLKKESKKSKEFVHRPKTTFEGRTTTTNIFSPATKKRKTFHHSKSHEASPTASPSAAPSAAPAAPVEGCSRCQDLPSAQKCRRETYQGVSRMCSHLHG